MCWTSKLQSEIALSTMESECIVLSHSMREVSPLLKLIHETHEVLDMPNSSKKCTTKCTVFEDNNSCIGLAKFPRLRPRTKHVGIKHHHFRGKVSNVTVNILPIDTKDQQEDVFAKSSSRDQFQKLCKFLIG